jgi:hypothetical protein
MSEKLYREVRECIVRYQRSLYPGAEDPEVVLSRLSDCISYEIDQIDDVDECLDHVLIALHHVIGDLRHTVMTGRHVRGRRLRSDAEKQLRLDVLAHLREVVVHERTGLRAEPVEPDPPPVILTCLVEHLPGNDHATIIEIIDEPKP